MNFNMVAIQPVGDYSEQGTPYSDRQRLGLARPQQDKSWDDADDEETTLLELMAQMQKQMLAVEARWSQHQEKKKRLQKSEEDKAEISERSRPDINVRSGDIAGISGNPTLPPGKVGNYPMQGDDSLSGSPKDLEVPPQEASTSTTEERYSYSPDGGDDVKGKTQQVELRIPGMLLPVKVDYSLVMSMHSENAKTKRNAERVFQEQMALHRYKEQQAIAEEMGVFTPIVGSIGVKGKEGPGTNRSIPPPKQNSAYTAPVGSSWRPNRPRTGLDKSRNKATESDSMEEIEEQSEHEEGDDGDSSDPDSSEDESEEERVKKKKKKSKDKPPDRKEMLRKSRKAAPNPKVCAALIKTMVKLNPEASNYRQWLTSLQEAAVSQGWPEHILNLKAETWCESPYESASDMKSRREAYQVILGSLDSKLLPGVETVREANNFGNAQLLFRKIKQLYSPASKVGEHRHIVRNLLGATMASTRLNIVEFGCHIVKLAADLKDMDEEMPERTLIDIYLLGVAAPLKEYGNQLLEMTHKGNPNLRTLDQVSIEMETYACRHGHSKFFPTVKQNAVMSEKQKVNDKLDKKKKSDGVKQAYSKTAGVECKHWNMCVKKSCADRHPPGHTLEIGIKNLCLETGGPCTRCKSYFHHVDDCTKGKDSERKCFNCKQVGHVKKDCKSMRQGSAQIKDAKSVTIKSKKGKIQQNKSQISYPVSADGIRLPIRQFATQIYVQEDKEAEDDLPDMQDSSSEEEEVLINVVRVGAQSLGGNNGKWYLDSGAQGNSHNPEVTKGTEPKPLARGTVIGGFIGETMKLETTERVEPPTVKSEVDITFRSYSVPGSNLNLLSMGALLEEGCEVVANKEGATVSHDRGGSVHVCQAQR